MIYTLTTIYEKLVEITGCTVYNKRVEDNSVTFLYVVYSVLNSTSIDSYTQGRDDLQLS